MSNVYCIEVALTIPDNEARTALRTLQRLGVPVSGLERADVYRCEVEGGTFDRTLAAFRSIETLFNPNKHVLRVLPVALPQAGEAWIDERSPRATYAGNDGAAGRNEHNDGTQPGVGTEPGGPAGVRIGGRLLPGLHTFERFVGWRLFGEDGRPAPPAVVAAATETLLCNPAFQKVTTETLT